MRSIIFPIILLISTMAVDCKTNTCPRGSCGFHNTNNCGTCPQRAPFCSKNGYCGDTDEYYNKGQTKYFYKPSGVCPVGGCGYDLDMTRLCGSCPSHARFCSEHGYCGNTADQGFRKNYWAKNN
jgi:hypothetical protein